LDDGSRKVLEILKKSGRLLGEGKIMHSYPTVGAARNL